MSEFRIKLSVVCVGFNCFSEMHQLSVYDTNSPSSAYNNKQRQKSSQRNFGISLSTNLTIIQKFTGIHFKFYIYKQKKITLKYKKKLESMLIFLFFFLTLYQKNKFYFLLNFFRIILSDLFIRFISSAFSRELKNIRKSQNEKIKI